MKERWVTYEDDAVMAVAVVLQGAVLALTPTHTARAVASVRSFMAGDGLGND